MDNLIDYDDVKSVLHHLNTDDTIASAHGILCGFACIKPDLALDDWLGEVLVSIDLNNLSEKSAHEQLAQIYNNTLLQLSDATLTFNYSLQTKIARSESKPIHLFSGVKDF